MLQIKPENNITSHARICGYGKLVNGPHTEKKIRKITEIIKKCYVLQDLTDNCDPLIHKEDPRV